MLYWKPVNKDDDEFNDDGWGPFNPDRKLGE